VTRDLFADTERHIGRRRIEAGEARTVIVRRVYDAPIVAVWDACTIPDRVNRWFLDVAGDLRRGGTFSLRGNAHGEIVECDPPRFLLLTWKYGDRPTDEVRLTLTALEGDRTRLEVEHATVTDALLNDPELGIWGIGIGWEMPMVYSLPAYLAGDLPDAPASEWFKPDDEVERLGVECGMRWMALVDQAQTD
jgi:uncharacterized protein YndB with AHSA1/START domain